MNLLFIQQDGEAVIESAPATPEVITYTETVDGVPVEDAAAAEAEMAPAGGGYSFWIMIIAMIAIMYFFMWRPESKRRKQMQKFRDGLKKGDKIITAGGIYGVVKEVDLTSLLIEVDSNVTLRVDKNMVVGDPANGVMQK